MRSNNIWNALVKTAAVAGVLLASGASHAAAVDVYLETVPYTVVLPGVVDPVPMWGFVCDPDATSNPACESVASGSPQINVAAGDELTIYVDNKLPVPVSLMIPGQTEVGGGMPEMFSDGLGRSRVQSFTHETAAGTTANYTWSNVRPGTYLYQSGTFPSIQVPMGLYGALVVDVSPGVAYPGVAYDADTVMLFSEIDPWQNAAVATAGAAVGSYPSTVDYSPTFFLLNGDVSGGSLPAVAQGDTVLLRFINAGLRSHIPSLVGLDMGLVAEDGNPYPGLARQQSTAPLAAGKTLDALVEAPSADITLALFDRMPSFNNAELQNSGFVANLDVGAGSPTPPDRTTYAVNDEYTDVTEDTAYAAVTSVMENDVGLDGATLSVASEPANGTLSLNSDGTFSYTPNPNFSGIDSFTYSALLLSNSYVGQVSLYVSFENDAPVANADAYSNAVGPDIVVAAPGVLANDADVDGDSLSAITVLDAAPASGTVALAEDGSFVYTGGTPGTTVSFEYHVTDGTTNSAPVAVELTVNEVSNVVLTVQDPNGDLVTDYRWLVQENATYIIDPDAPPLPTDTLSTNFHKSYMPVIAQGCLSCETEIPFEDLALDPTKHYYVSILPNDAGTGEGHTIGGAQIAPGQSAVTVVVNNQEIPTAQISVLVFEDNYPTNGAPDTTESRLGGFQIILEDAGGRYGISGGTMSQDYKGDPLTNALFGTPGCPGSQPVGVILTCPDGTALIQNLPPGKYGVIAVPPSSEMSDWKQTSTIEGTKVIDAWVIANEPPFFAEFGVASFHAFFGFVNPAHTTVPEGPPGQQKNTITGSVTMIHPARAPSPESFDSGSYDALAHTRAWIGLNSAGGGGPNISTVQAAPDGSFAIDGIPDGTYQLVIWDDYLDQIIYFQTVILPGGSNVGNIPVNTWFGRQEHNVYLDANQNGTREAGEAPLPEQAVNLRWRDGTVFQSFPTDTDGFVPFDQIFPFGSWQVAEVDYTRFKATGLTVTVDGGGDVSGGPYPGLLNPQAGSPRTELGPVLTEGFQSLAGMTSIYEWGKAPYAAGENGGISGIVFYGSTRGENDPRLTVGDPWEPGIPGATVRLYREVATDFSGGKSLALVAETETDSWDDNLPTGCEGEVTPNDFVDITLAGDAKRCFDGVRNWEQARPAVFDGGYAFNDIPAGTYVVEVQPPPGYELIKEQDVNVGFGDSFGTGGPFMVAPVILPNGMLTIVVPGPADVEAAMGAEPGIAQPPCVGQWQVVPDELSLFPGMAAPFAGAARPLCDRKKVILSDRGQAAADFHLFTSTPVAGQFQGLTTDDIAIETDPASPSFGDKWGPAFMPISMRDFNGHEIYRTYSDAFGRYNGVLPSTFTANIPIPSGYSPAMHFVCLNDGALPDGSLDPKRNPNYGTFCYTLQYMPGTTTYLDTPLIPQAAFAAGFNSVDCACVDGTPVVKQVDGTGTGPLVAAGGTLTIQSAGITAVPNPNYEGPLGADLNLTVDRDFGFGASGAGSSVSLDGVELTGVMWSDATISGTVPATLADGSYQLVVTRDNGKTSINTVTVTVGTETPITVSPGPGAIQAAIDAAAPGALILVGPGVYDELVVMHKPVRLQGSGSGTVINALRLPSGKLDTWRTKVKGLIDSGDIDLLPGQPAGDFNLVGGGLFGTELGAGVTVLSKNDGSWNSTNAPRVDGFTITGADAGGGIFVNGYAHNLEISNNYVSGNMGNYGGGVRVGHPFLEPAGNGPFAYSTDLNIHHNAITLNGARSSGAVGGGLSLNTGTDRYDVSENFVCGNFSLGDGGGIGHYGLSNNGRIASNQILFNQSFNPSVNRSGGGIIIAGEPSAAGLTLGAGNVTIDANLIQGNQAGSGHGGGIRTQAVNGRDVELSNQTGNWYAVRMTNNIVTNNVAGWSGGGISMQDTVNASILLNTISNNDSTGTAGAVLGLGPQPAGISSARNSLALDAAIPGNASSRRNFSNPELTHNIVWHNRAFTYDATGGTATARLLPELDAAAIGDCDAGANYLDLGVLDPGFKLQPRRSILSSTSGYPGNNTSADPQFLAEYCNGSRKLSDPGPMLVAVEVTEGGNFIDVRYGPLTRGVLTSDLPSYYHIASTSPAIDRNGPQPAGAGVDHDFDQQARPVGPRIDVGADEYSPPVVPPPPQPADPGTATYTSGAFGAVPINTTQTRVITATVSVAPVTFTSSSNPAAPFAKTGDTCSGNTVAVGNSCSFTVDYSPTAVGIDSASLIVANDADGNPQPVELSGEGALPGVVEIASASFGSLGGGTLQFGTLSNGNYSSVITLSVGELTPVTFNNLSIAGSGRFTKGADSCSGATLSSGGSCSVTVNFNANGNTVRNATLQFPHNGAGPVSLGLTGR